MGYGSCAGMQKTSFSPHQPPRSSCFLRAVSAIRALTGRKELRTSAARLTSTWGEPAHSLAVGSAPSRSDSSLLENALHFVDAECAQCFRPRGSPRAGAQHNGRGGLLVRRLENNDAVVAAHRPVDFPGRAAHLFDVGFEPLGALDRILDRADSLIGPSEQ